MVRKLMVTILIDPIIVATPDPETEEQVISWLSNFEIWMKEARSSLYDWSYCPSAIIELIDCQRYPNSKKLQSWTRKYNSDKDENHKLDLDIGWISKQLSRFFNAENDASNNYEVKLQDWENKLLTEGYYAEPENDATSIKPDEFIQRWPGLLPDIMYAILATTCLYKQYSGKTVIDDLQLATLALDSNLRQIEITTVIKNCIPTIELEIGNQVFETFSLIFAPEDLPQIEVTELWDLGEAGFRRAVNQYLNKVELPQKTKAPFEYIVGAEFFASIERVGLQDNHDVLSKVVRAVAIIISDMPDYSSLKIHEKRKGDAADSPQEIREYDKAKAWRADVTLRGAGWRLHYWQIPDSKNGSIIELHKIVKESSTKM
jgi:hypothetical protein